MREGEPRMRRSRGMVDWSELREVYREKSTRSERRRREQEQWAEAARLYGIWAEAALAEVIAKVHSELSRCARDFESAPDTGFSVMAPRLVPWPSGQHLRVVCFSQGPHSVHIYGQRCPGQAPALHLLRLRQVRARPDAVMSLAGAWLARESDGRVTLRAFEPEREVLSIEAFTERAVRLFVSGFS